MRTLVFDPLVPIGLWVGLALAALAALAIYAVSMRGRLAPKARNAVVGLMSLMVALPLVILLNPQWVERLPPPAGKPVLTLIVDGTASMATPDGADGRTRLAEARSVAHSIADRLQDRYKIEPLLLAGSLGPLDLTADSAIRPEGKSTDLAAALDAVLVRDRPQGQAILLLSDGIHNAGGGEARVIESARRAKAMAAPVYTKTIGGQSSVRDLAVEIRSPQELAFVGQQIPLRAAVQPHGLAGRRAELVLARDEVEIELRSLPIVDDEPIDVEFSVGRDSAGICHYELRVEPLADEVTPANNSATFLLRVVDEPIRVLLLEGKPYWDTKFLLRTLAADPSLELVSVVRLAKDRLLRRRLGRPGKPAVSEPDTLNLPAPIATQPLPAATEAFVEAEEHGSPAAPVGTHAVETHAGETHTGDGRPAAGGRNEDWKILTATDQVLADPAELRSFQIIILGRDAEAYLTDAALERVKHWISHDGGSLVCFRGPPTAQVSQRLAQILPVRWDNARESRFHMRWTDDGLALGWLGSAAGDADELSHLPTLAMHAQPGRPQPLATVLAVGELSSGNVSPVVTALPLGTGRVVAVEGAGMWRWAFLAPQYRDHQQVYSALWHSLSRWLVSNTGLLPSQVWALRSDKVRFDVGEEPALSLLMRAAALPGGVPQVELSGGDLAAPEMLTPVPGGDDPGSFRVVCPRLSAGRYAAQIVGSSPAETAARTVFDVRENVDELTHLSANPGLMQRVAEVSGGLALQEASPDEVSARIEQHLARSRPERVRTTSAWDRWWVLLGVLGVWALTWGWRRQAGLI